MGDFHPSKFTIDTSLANAADEWSAEVPGAAALLNASELDRVTLAVGLVRNGIAESITVIEDGVVDSYEFIDDATGRIATKLTGRDQMARLRTQPFRRIYRNGPAPKVLDGQVSIPEVEGLATASEIASAICSFAGLLLHWECPDYLIHEQFSAVGRPLDLLQNLVRPFSLLPELRKVDVYAVGSTVYCRQRALHPTAPAVNVISIKAARIRLQIRKFQTDKIGLLTLQGMGLTQPSEGGAGGAQDVPQITWESPEEITYPTALSSTQLNAEADVDGTFVYDPPAGTILHPGSRTLKTTFTPTDTIGFKSATGSTSLSVQKATPVVTWSTPSPIAEGTALSGTQLNATADVAGSFHYSPASGHVMKAGTTQLNVTFVPSNITDYEVVTASVTLVVTGTAPTTTPTIVWPAPAPISEGVALSGAQLNATEQDDVPGTFEYTPPAGTLLAAGTHALKARFLPTDTVTYQEVITTVSLQVVQPRITWSSPSQVEVGTALDDQQLNASANVEGTFVYTPPSGTIMTAVGTTSLSVTFTPTDGGSAVSKTVSLRVVAKDPAGGGGTLVPVLTWLTPPSIIWPTPLTGAQLNATSNVPGEFDYSPPEGTVLDPGSQSLTANFTPTDPAYKSGTVKTSIFIQSLTPTLVWSAPAPITAGTVLSATQLNATALDVESFPLDGFFTYHPDAGTEMTAGIKTLSVHFAPNDSTHYETAQTSVLITVTGAPPPLVPVIVWPTPEAIIYAQPLSDTQLNATSDVAGTFEYTPGEGTTLSPGTKTLTAHFVPDDPDVYQDVTLTVSLKIIRVVVSWPRPSDLVIGQALGTAQLRASANVDGAFVYDPPAGTVMTEAGSFVLAVVFTPTISLTDETVDPVTKNATVRVVEQPDGGPETDSAIEEESSLAYDRSGGLISTVHTTSTYRIPQRLLIREKKLTYTAQPLSYTGGLAGPLLLGDIEIKDNEWEPTVLGPSGPANQPKPLREMMTRTRELPLSGLPWTVAGSEMIYTYDDPTVDPRGLLKMTVLSEDEASGSAIESIDPSGGGQVITGPLPPLVPSKRTTKAYRDLKKDMYLVTTDVDQWQPSGAPPANGIAQGTWQRIHHDETPSPGTRPGGVDSSQGKDSTPPGGHDVPTLTWETPEAITFPTALSGTQLNAEADVSGSFVYSPGDGAILHPGERTLLATFTPMDLAVYKVSTVSTTIHVDKATPVVTWEDPDDIAEGVALSDTQLNATADVPGTFHYTPAAGRVLKAGIYTLQVTFKPSNATDYATVQADAALTVTGTPPPSTPSLSWSTPTPISEGVALSGTQLNATLVQGPFDDPIPGEFQYSPAAGNALSPGVHTLHVRFVPEDQTTYADATASVLLEVIGITITWRTPAEVVVNTALSEAQLNATANVEGEFVYTPVEGTVVSAVGTVTLATTFTPADGGKAISKSVTLKVVDHLPGGTTLVPHLSWLTPAPVTWPTLLSATQLNPTADIDGAFEFDPAAGEIPDPGSQSLSATFTPTDPAYREGSVRTTLSVHKAISTLTWANPANMVAGQTLSATQLNATASVDGTITYSPDAGTEVTAGTKTLHASFSPVDSIHYEGEQAKVTLVVTGAPPPLTPIVTWATPAPIVYGQALDETQLNATADVAGTFEYSPGFGSTPSAGTRTLRLHFQPDDPDTYSDVTVEVTLEVIRAKVTWAKPDALPIGGMLDETRLNATANVSGIFIYTPPAGTVMNEPGTVTLSVEFTPSAVGPSPVTDTVTLKVVDPVTGAGTGLELVGYASVQRVIDPDPTAQPVDLSDSNLDQETLDLIAEQVAACSGLWQWEVRFTGPGIPWLRKGDILELTDYVDDTGTPIPIPPLLVRDLKQDYDEAGARSHIRDGLGLAWTEP